MFSQEVADRICERLIEGESLRAICRDDKMPALRSVFDWLDAQPEFRTKYARARELQAEVLVDEMQEIADGGQNDWMEQRDREGEVIGYKLNGEAVSRSKLRLEQRRWFAEKLLPKKYGQKMEMTVEVNDRASVLRKKREERLAGRSAG